MNAVIPMPITPLRLSENPTLGEQIGKWVLIVVCVICICLYAYMALDLMFNYNKRRNNRFYNEDTTHEHGDHAGGE